MEKLGQRFILVAAALNLAARREDNGNIIVSITEQSEKYGLHKSEYIISDLNDEAELCKTTLVINNESDEDCKNVLMTYEEAIQTIMMLNQKVIKMKKLVEIADSLKNK